MEILFIKLYYFTDHIMKTIKNIMKIIRKICYNIVKIEYNKHNCI